MAYQFYRLTNMAITYSGPEPFFIEQLPGQQTVIGTGWTIDLSNVPGDIVLSGEILSDFGVLLDTGTDGSTVRVESTARVEATNAAGYAIASTASNNTVVNDGEIASPVFGVLLNAGLAGEAASLINNGLIDAPVAVYSTAGAAHVTNTGLIRAISASYPANYGVLITGDESHLENYGTILGRTAAVYLGGSDQSVFNAGRIEIRGAGTDAIEGTGGAQRILNRGVIDGDVSLNGGDDLYVGLRTGRVTGEIDLGADDDTAYGSNAADRFDGGDGADTIFGRGGDDVIRDMAGGVMAYGGVGEDTIIVAGGGTARGQAGNDTLVSGATGDTLFGDGGRDVMRGNAGNDVMYGGSGNDRMFGGVGFNSMYGDSGEDLIVGGGDTDFAYGGAHADEIRGGGGNDFVYGEGGNDRLLGHAGNDQLHGGDNNDLLIGGPGSDTLLGEDGNDRMRGGADLDQFFYFIADQGTDRILDFQDGIDKITISGAATLTALEINQAISRIGTTDHVRVNLGAMGEAGLTGTIIVLNMWGDLNFGDFNF